MSTLATGRSIHSPFRTWNWTLAIPSSPAPLAGAVEHPLGLVGDQHLPPGRDQLGRQQARSRRAPPPARAPALRAGVRRHPPASATTGAPKASICSCRRRQPVAAASQLLDARRRARRGPRSSAAPCAAACPSGSAAAARRRQRDLLGHLVRGERARAVGAQLLARRRTAALAARTTSALTASPQLLVGAARTTPASSTTRVALQHRLDLRRRDVLAAADDRLRLAAGAPTAGPRVELAEIAGVQPAVVGERRGRDRRPAHQDLLVGRDPHAACRTVAGPRRRSARVRGARRARRPAPW